MSEDASERIPTNLRTLLILEILGRMDDPPTAAEIGRVIGLPKQTIHRLCTTLIEEGFLARSEIGGGLYPSRRARELAAGILHGSSASIARYRILTDLANDIGETVNFVVPEEGGMSYKDRVETNWAFRIQLPVGSHVPFHCTASGKTYLSTLPRSRREGLVSSLELIQMTQNTIVDPDALLDELREVRRQGFAQDNEEFIDGMVAMAVPVRDRTGRYIASLAFHGPMQRVSLAKAYELTPKLVAAADRLQTALF